MAFLQGNHYTHEKCSRPTAQWVLLIVCAAAIAALVTNLASAQTVTYSSLTSPNASAGAANVSKLPMSSALPPTSQAKVYAHMLSWFGNGSHKDVGYNSADVVQVEKQVADMISRGFSGAIVKWQGQTDFTNQAALAVMAEAEKNSTRFQFSIEEDAAALSQCAATSGCDLQAKVVSDVNFILSTYAKSATYMKFQGHAVIFFYGMEAYNLNWTAIENGLTQRPILVLRSTVSSLSTISEIHFPEAGTDSPVNGPVICREYRVMDTMDAFDVEVENV